ncbi:MAG: hypothetical protein ACKOPM_11860 [Novosphingobium sp.]
MTGKAGPKQFALTGTLGFALLAIGNGLDRSTGEHPGLARLVPALLASEARRSEAATALAKGDFGLSQVIAAAAVRTDPIDPRSAALLGAAQLGAGEQVRADRSFRVAARFGWRDPLTQLYFMNSAFVAGQPRLAALRLDAVLRQAPKFPMRDQLLAQFEANPAGRAALAERLALKPAWTDEFLGEGNNLPLDALQSRAAIVVAVPGPKWGCDAVAPLVTRLVLRGGPVQAKALWQAHCPEATAGIADPRFASLASIREPVAFEWNLVGSGDISAAQALPAGSGLTVRLTGPSARPVAWQLLVLKPGRYRLSWTASAQGAAAGRASLTLSCDRDDRTPVAATSLDGKGRQTAEVPIDGSCPARFLVLWLKPGSEEIRFDNLAITPL